VKKDQVSSPWSSFAIILTASGFAPEELKIQGRNPGIEVQLFRDKERKYVSGQKQ
jgi:hypothetical protein